ncbi:MAG: hypothetical protein ACI4K7_05185 [Oscillospiraceae bacterium]
MIAVGQILKEKYFYMVGKNEEGNAREHGYTCRKCGAAAKKQLSGLLLKDHIGGNHGKSSV